MCLKHKYYTMAETAKELGYSFAHFNQHHKAISKKIGLIVETMGEGSKVRYFFRKDSVAAALHNADIEARKEIK